MQIYDVPPNDRGWSLVLHGGAGGRVEELTLDVRGSYTEGLTRAYRAGAGVLAAGGSALDAVCATVEQLEDDPLFNAGRGAALTAAGTAELDACVMTGDGRAGAITACRCARNPVHAARKVMEETSRGPARRPHGGTPPRLGARDRPAGVLPDPGAPAAAAQRAVPAARGLPARHRRGRGPRRDGAGWQPRPRPAEWSTRTRGGWATPRSSAPARMPATGWWPSRAPARARPSSRGSSPTTSPRGCGTCGQPLAAAITATVEEELTAHGAMGGLIAVGADGTVTVAHNSPAMFSAYHDGTRARDAHMTAPREHRP